MVETAIIRQKDKRIKIDVIASGSKDIPLNLICINCKQHSYMVVYGNNDYRCGYCGEITQGRTVKHGRGIAAPSIQQDTAVVQPERKYGYQRKPRGINNNKRNPLAESLEQKGFQIIDSQHIEREP